MSIEVQNPKPRTRRKPKDTDVSEKKIDETEDTRIIETLRQSIEKPINEDIIESNLNKPDDLKDKTEKRQRRRKKNLENGDIKEESFEHENKAFEIDEIDEEKIKNKEEVIAEEQNKPSKPRRRKEKKIVESTNEEISGNVQENITADNQEQQQEEPHEIEEKTRKSKGPRKSRKKKQQSEEELMIDQQMENQNGNLEMHDNIAGPQQDVEEEIRQKITTDEGKVVNVTIHRTDRLKTDLNVLHPMVQISIVDVKTGTYLVKQNRDRRVVSYNEDTERVSVILPVMTQPFEYKYNRGTIPSWNESIIFDENSNYIINNPNVIIFFELLDLNSAYSIQKSYQSDGFRHVAWAFLRPVGCNGTLNTGRKVRLQLYECGSTISSLPNNAPADSIRMLSVFQWWRINLRKMYPSTLYVTIAGIELKRDMDNEVIKRSMFPHIAEGEKGDGTNGVLDRFGQIGKGKAGKNSRNRLLNSALAFWSRLPGQLCHVPNEAISSLSCSNITGGYSILSFSPSGEYLASGGVESSDEYPVVLFNLFQGIKTPSEIYRGHSNIIHCMAWSSDGVWLASGSADGTCRLWRIGTNNPEPTLEDTQINGQETSNSIPEPNTSSTIKVDKKVLSHPCFVYAVQFHPKCSSLIVTASFDKIIRLWNIRDDKREILQRLDGHKGYINSIVFNLDGTELFSGDSIGSILVWKTPINEQYILTEPYKEKWKNSDIIDEFDLRKVIINCIILSTSGKRLYVHGRDGAIRLIDLKIKSMVMKFHGFTNSEKNMKSCLSPCGSFLFCGNEDMIDGSHIYIWNAQTGDHVAMYKNVNLVSPATTMEYHPRCHLIAFSGVGSGNNILLYGYDSSKAKIEMSTEDDYVDSNRTASVRVNSTLTGIEDKQQHLYQTRELDHSTERLHKALSKMNQVLEANKKIKRSTYDQNLSRSDVMSENGPESRGRAIRTMHKTSDVAAIPMTLSTSSTGKANFTFRPPIHPSSASSKNRNRNYLGDVHALYDYQAQRADELSFVKDEIIKIVFRDGKNWLLGETSDGSQGYLPSNYVDSDHLIESTEVSLLEEEPKRTIRFEDESPRRRRNSKQEHLKKDPEQSTEVNQEQKQQSLNKTDLKHNTTEQNPNSNNNDDDQLQTTNNRRRRSKMRTSEE